MFHLSWLMNRNEASEDLKVIYKLIIILWWRNDRLKQKRNILRNCPSSRRGSKIRTTSCISQGYRARLHLTQMRKRYTKMALIIIRMTSILWALKTHQRLEGQQGKKTWTKKSKDCMTYGACSMLQLVF